MAAKQTCESDLYMCQSQKLSNSVVRNTRCSSFASAPLILAILLMVPTHSVSTNLGGEEYHLRQLTVADAIETSRMMPCSPRHSALVSRQSRQASESGICISPNGMKYVIGIVRGDIQRNGNWLEVRYGELSSLSKAAEVKIIAQLFTRGTGSSRGGGLARLTLPTIADSFVWFEDSNRVAFLWEDETHTIQVLAINITTGKLEYLTHHPTDVLRFAISRDGSLLYSAGIEPSIEGRDRLLRKGFVVTNLDAYSLIDGDVDGAAALARKWNTETFIAESLLEPPRKVIWSGQTEDRYFPLRTPKFSPDGRYAIIDGSPSAIPCSWERYTSTVLKLQVKQSCTQSPDGFLGRSIRQLYVLQMDRASARPLWNAPSPRSLIVSWSPDSKSAVVGPAYLPPEHSDSTALAGHAVAEIDIATGKFLRVPLPSDIASESISQIQWLGHKTIEIRTGDSIAIFDKDKRGWHTTPYAKHTHQVSAPVRVEVRQDLNSPPAMFAVDVASGREKLIFDLNPQFRNRFSLGRVELVTWRDPDHRDWNGLLYYPVGYEPGRRFPLVIQTHGHAPPTEFSLYGIGAGLPGLGPSISVYAAQPLANRGIAVLQVEDKIIPGSWVTPREADLNSNAYEAAIQHLVGAGLVMRDKVGLMGFSRTGWYVEYALTHSNFHYAAAIVADNLNAGYMQTTLLWSEEWAAINGALPFGDGMKVWLERAPGFMADRIRTPLRLQRESGGLSGLLGSWEMFNRLRLLDKPVEYFVIPDIRNGSHALQNPAQCLAAQQGAVDWFDFWLNGNEDNDPEKRDQYSRWRELRVKHERQMEKLKSVSSFP